MISYVADDVLLSAERIVMNRNIITRKIIRIVYGLFIFSVGTTLTRLSNIGMAPWVTLSTGISYRTGISYGTITALISGIIVIIDLCLKEPIGIGTILDAVLCGYFSDFIVWTGFVPDPKTMFGGIIMTLIGIALSAYGQYFYMSAQLGCGPRDTLFIALGKRLRRMSIGMVQTIILVVVFGIGWLLGAPAGIGTLINVFCTGYIMQGVFRLLHFDPRELTQVGLFRGMRILIQNTDTE